MQHQVHDGFICPFHYFSILSIAITAASISLTSFQHVAITGTASIVTHRCNTLTTSWNIGSVIVVTTTTPKLAVAYALVGASLIVAAGTGTKNAVRIIAAATRDYGGWTVPTSGQSNVGNILETQGSCQRKTRESRWREDRQGGT